MKNKKQLPKFNGWMHENAVSVFPYVNLQLYPYKGKTSDGCIAFQATFGWMLWSASLQWTYSPRPEVSTINIESITINK